jgi:hypothetical protein
VSDRDEGNRIEDPKDRSTGDEPITHAQASYLRTLANEAGEEADTEGMTKAQAAERIEELQRKTGRGLGDAGD